MRHIRKKHSIVSQKSQRLGLMILDGPFCEVGVCVKSHMNPSSYFWKHYTLRLTI